MKLYLNGKKITQKEAKKLMGEAQYKKFIAESKKYFMMDPFEEQSCYIGAGCISVEF